jgi:hypothetical protein
MIILGMMETIRRKITVNVVFNEISTDQLGNTSGGGEGGGRYSARPHPFLKQASGQILKDDVNSFSYISDICFMMLGCS